MSTIDLQKYPHRRLNILTGEWVLVSPQRTQRPWQGEVAAMQRTILPAYDPACYLCPGNKRVNGDINPKYNSTYSFTNDFSSLLPDTPDLPYREKSLLNAKTERGICRVVNFSPLHNRTLADMTPLEIGKVISVWQNEFHDLSKKPFIKYIQIFENKGIMMGNSNPHPHCQIWAQEHIPEEPLKEHNRFRKYYREIKRSLLADYITLELKQKERIVYANDSFVIVVPFWAVWPYETMIVPRRKVATIVELSSNEKTDYAQAINVITFRYDKLFNIPFPYSSGIHQSPTDGKKHNEWHFHMHFYPPLLRSAKVKKFMVGYEMLAEPQRDFTPETAAEILRNL